jgi:outer membrane protein TolC
MIPYPIRHILTLLLITLQAAFPLQAQEDSLGCYLAVAAANNPSVHSAYLTYEASLEKLPQAGAYADPTLEMGVFPSPMELVGGRQVAQFQVMQMFPWFGTRKAARTEAQHMANMAFEQFREARDNVFLEVHTQWYALCALRQQLINSEANRQWMEQLEQLALRKYTSASAVRENAYPAPGGNTPAVRTAPSSGNMNMGGGNSMPPAPSPSAKDMPQMDDGMQKMGNTAQGMSEVLRIQLEKMELENRIENLHAEIKAGKALFNSLLNRAAGSDIVLPDTLIRIPFHPDAETILREINDRNPMLEMLRQEALAYDAKAGMNRKMGYPMLGVGLQYMLMAPLENTPAGSMDGMETGTSPMMNGKDMLMPMLSVTIPLYRNKYKAAQKESRLLRRASEAKQADALNRLEAGLHQSVYLLGEAARRIDLYRRQAALAQSAGNLATQEFVSGKTDLGSVIQIQRQLLDYQLKEADATATYNTIVATIRKMISSFTI